MTAVVEQPYRSKDEQFMGEIRDAIMLNRNFSMVDRMWAYEYSKRRVFLDDLHRWAIKELGGEMVVDMGEGTTVPSLILVTYRKPSTEERQVQDAIIRALGLPLEAFYRTWLVKGSREESSDLQTYNTLLESELGVLKAPAISFGFCFGDVDGGCGDILDFRGGKLLVTRHIKDIVATEQDDAVEAKREVWAHIKSLLSYTNVN